MGLTVRVMTVEAIRSVTGVGRYYSGCIRLLPLFKKIYKSYKLRFHIPRMRNMDLKFYLAFRGQNTLRALLIREEVSVDTDFKIS